MERKAYLTLNYKCGWWNICVPSNSSKKMTKLLECQVAKCANRLGEKKWALMDEKIVGFMIYYRWQKWSSKPQAQTPRVPMSGPATRPSMPNK
jgi:hypothetical protein